MKLTGNRTSGFHQSLARDKFLAVSSSLVPYNHNDVALNNEVGRAAATCVVLDPAVLNGRGVLTYSADIMLTEEAQINSVAVLDANSVVLFEANLPTPLYVNAGFPTAFELEVSI